MPPPPSPSPLPFWLLMTALVALLLLGRILAGWLWHGFRRLIPRVNQLLRRFVYRGRLIDRLAARWPRTMTFVARRFAVGRFTGLPLTLMAVLGAYLIFLGAGLAEDVIEGDSIVAFDHQINNALAILRDPVFLHVFAAITAMANLSTLVAVVLVTIGFLWSDQRLRYIPGLLLAVLGSQTITYVGKYAINRDRPDFLTFASATTPSFPSGHATGAIAVYGFIIYAIARDTPGVRERFELAYWGSALIALIAASRAVLSVHFASDIAAGLLVGGFWLLAGFALTEYLRDRDRARAKGESRPG